MKATNKAFLIAFGVNLDRLIKSKGLTPQDVAANADIEFKQVYRVINAENSATLSVINAIARGLGVHPKELFDFDYEEK